MGKRSFALFLSLALLLGLTAPAGAYDMGHVGQLRIVSCGQDHTAVLQGDGSLWTMGGGSRGQLGNGSTEQSMVPVKVLDQVASVTCGKYQTLAIRADGSLWTWGLTQNRYLGLSAGNFLDESMGSMNQTLPYKVMDNVAAVSCGEFHTAAVKSDGTLWTWGQNSEGQLGNGIIGDQPVDNSAGWAAAFGKPQTEPVPEPETVFHVMDDVVAVACGNSHTAALKSDGTLWTWGNNYWGQLGSPNVSTDDCCPTPTQVLDQVAAISCGDYFTAAVRTDGSLWMWGSNTFSTLGNGSTGNVTRPTGDVIQTVPVKVLDGVAAVSCGPDHVAAIKTDGSLWMWGDNDDSQIGSGLDGEEKSTYTEPVKVLDNVIAVSCGASHTAAVTGDGTLYTWGNPRSGQLGNGGGGNVCRTYWVEEIPVYPNPIPAHTSYVYHQTVPAAVMNLAVGGILPPTTPPAPVGGFSDVLDNDYFAQPVLWAVEQKVTSGTSATTFSPDATCSTAEALTFLWRASGSPAPAGSDAAVSAGQYYTDAVNWALEQGLTGTFTADAPATRAAMVTYLWKLAGSPDAAPASFSDVPAGADYAQAVAWAVAEGVTSGTGDNAFSPDGVCTRAQIVTFLYRALAA